MFASPEPLAFWRRDVVWRQGGALTFGTFDPLQGKAGLSGFGKPVPDNMADPRAVAAAQKTAHVRKFLAWSQLPMASIETVGRCTRISFGDARFSGPALSRSFRAVVDPCGGD